MSDLNVNPDPVAAVRADIEATRTDLVETVSELSDRLSPKKRVSAVTQDVNETAKQAVGHAEQVTKDATAKAHHVALSNITRGRQLVKGREGQLAAVLVIMVGSLLAWRLRRHPR